jgi:hypothetical protein
VGLSRFHASMRNTDICSRFYVMSKVKDSIVI